MSLHDEIRSAQVRAGEDAVIRNLERMGLKLETESRLQVLEREHQEFFERWHDERRKREKWQAVVVAAVELVCAPAWAGVSDEDVKLEQALRDAGLVRPNVRSNRRDGIAGTSELTDGLCPASTGDKT